MAPPSPSGRGHALLAPWAGLVLVKVLDGVHWIGIRTPVSSATASLPIVRFIDRDQLECRVGTPRSESCRGRQYICSISTPRQVTRGHAEDGGGQEQRVDRRGHCRDREVRREGDSRDLHEAGAGGRGLDQTLPRPTKLRHLAVQSIDVVLQLLASASLRHRPTFPVNTDRATSRGSDHAHSGSGAYGRKADIRSLDRDDPESRVGTPTSNSCLARHSSLWQHERQKPSE